MSDNINGSHKRKRLDPPNERDLLEAYLGLVNIFMIIAAYDARHNQNSEIAALIVTIISVIILSFRKYIAHSMMYGRKLINTLYIVLGVSFFLILILMNFKVFPRLERYSLALLITIFTLNLCIPFYVLWLFSMTREKIQDKQSQLAPGEDSLENSA